MNYFIEYKYLTDLVLYEVVEIHHSAEFIDEILISTEPREVNLKTETKTIHLGNALKIKFNLSAKFDNCEQHELEKFFDIYNYPISLEKGMKDYEFFLKDAKRKIAFQKTEEITEDICDILYFYDKQFCLSDKPVNNNIPNICIIEPATYKLACEFDIFISNKKLSVEQLHKNKLVKKSIESPKQSDFYYKILRKIKENKEMDNISKYVILYSLLMEASGKGGKNNQNKVDDAIKEFSKYRQTEVGKDQQGKPKKMTKITWLRNEIGHTSQKDFDLDKLRKEIDEYLNPLFEILKRTLVKYVFNK